MNLLTKIMQIFNKNTEQKKVLLKNDIKFSTLIQNIQKDVIEANESLEFIGLKYIEQFFEKEPETNKVEEISEKLTALEKQLSTGNNEAANKMIVDLKADVTRLTTSNENEVIHYRPKMTSFEVPIFKNGHWRTEALTVPLFSLSQVQIPKIKELTFTSTVQNVQHEGEDVYVRFRQNEPVSRWRRNKLLNNEQMTEIKISIQPENHSDNVNDVIAHYEQVLRAH